MVSCAGLAESGGAIPAAMEQLKVVVTWLIEQVTAEIAKGKSST